MQCYIKDIQIIENVQRRGVRLITQNYNCTQSVTSLRKDLKLDTLEQRRNTTSLCVLNKVINNNIAINPDEYLKESLSNTRKKNNQQFQHIRPSTEQYKNSFFPRTIPKWNNLTQSVIDSSSLEVFKNKVTLLNSH